jgi:hypothetical protein
MWSAKRISWVAWWSSNCVGACHPVYLSYVSIWQCSEFLFGRGGSQGLVGTDCNCVVTTTTQLLPYDDRLSVGWVEVCSGGMYGTVCDDVWMNEAASVACRPLEFSLNLICPMGCNWVQVGNLPQPSIKECTLRFNSVACTQTALNTNTYIWEVFNSTSGV